MSIKLFTSALTRAHSGEAQLLLAWSKEPTPALVEDIFQATRRTFGREPLVLELYRMGASEVRLAFIRAVGSGSSVLATRLDTLDPAALDAALLGLVSVHQWNKKAFGIGLSSAPITFGTQRFKTINQQIEPNLLRAPRF